MLALAVELARHPAIAGAAHHPTVTAMSTSTRPWPGRIGRHTRPTISAVALLRDQWGRGGGLVRSPTRIRAALTERGRAGTRYRRPLITVAIVNVALVLAGCGQNVLDATKDETKIEALVLAATGQQFATAAHGSRYPTVSVVISCRLGLLPK
jgi:hypothetical protein